MIEELEIQKLKIKYPEFFAQFSPEFLDFIFSEEISLEIATICLENNIEDEETIDKIAYQITLALFNQVPKENLAKIFEKEAGLNLVIAEKIAFEIEERIFSQMPESQPIESSVVESGTILPLETKMETKPKEKRRDAYRELIE